MGANLKEVRLRIASVKSTTQITKAMKMVSAAKLRRATERIVQIRPYADQLNTVLQNIASNLGDEMNTSFAQQRAVNRVLIVIITSDKGLCGGFNANSIKSAKALLNDKYPELAAKGKVDILTVGKKGYDAFKSSKLKVNNDFGHLFGNTMWWKWYTDNSKMPQRKYPQRNSFCLSGQRYHQKAPARRKRIICLSPLRTRF
jgi:F-type H+-transporting ATPase subunit gamma